MNLRDHGVTQFEEWKYTRLRNWGRSQWNALMADAPDSSCANPIYQNFIWHDDSEGSGEVTDETVRVQQDAPARAELPPVDEVDAEVVGGWVKQLFKGHRAVLCRRYVLLEKVDMDAVDNAIHALLNMVYQNRTVVDRMRLLGVA